MQERMDTIQEWKDSDSVEEEFMTGGTQERRVRRKGGIQVRRVAGLEGCNKSSG